MAQYISRTELDSYYNKSFIAKWKADDGFDTQYFLLLDESIEEVRQLLPLYDLDREFCTDIGGKHALLAVYV